MREDSRPDGEWDSTAPDAPPDDCSQIEPSFATGAALCNFSVFSFRKRFDRHEAGNSGGFRVRTTFLWTIGTDHQKQGQFLHLLLVSFPLAPKEWNMQPPNRNAPSDRLLGMTSVSQR